MASSAYTVQVGSIVASPSGTTYLIARDSLQLSDQIGQRATCSFLLTDMTGLQHFSQGQPVTVSDANGQIVFSGFVRTSKERRRTFAGAITHSIDCIDMTWLAKKRVAAKSYTATLAGDIAADLVASYLVNEGVIGTRTAPTFARASIATRNNDGVDVTSGTPRYEPGGLAATSALRIEEGVTNLLSTNQSNVETDTTGFTALSAATITRDTTEHWQGAASLKVVTSGVAGQAAEASLANANFTAGATYTISVWLKGAGNVRLFLREDGSATAVGGSILGATLTGTWTRYKLTVTMPNPLVAGGYGLTVDIGTAQTTTWYMDGLQIEAKSYATTWQVGGTARAAESLMIPAKAAFNPGVGTLQFRAFFDATVRRQPGAVFTLLVANNGAGAAALRIQHAAAAATWTLFTAADSGASTSVTFNDSNTPDGWHAIAIAWDAASAIVYVDNVAVGTIVTPALPSTLATQWALGSGAAGGGQTNTLYQDVRLSSRKRTGAEIAADSARTTLLPLDDATAYLLPLNGATTVSTSLEAGPSVGEAIFNYAHISDCLDKLAEVAGKWWNIDANRLLHLQAPASLAAPQAITGATMEQDAAVSVERAAPLYRNRQYITGGTDLTSSQVETRIGDGNAVAFTLAYPFAKVPTVEVKIGAGSFVAKTVGIKGVDTGKDWYWSKGDPVLAQDSAGVKLTSADTLRVTYQGQFPLIYVAEATDQVTANQAAEGGTTTGYVDEVDTVSGTTSSTSAGQYAAAKLARYAQGGITVTFPTRTAGFKSGQIADVSLSSHGLSHLVMLIEEVSAADVELDIWYTVKCVAGPVDSTWLDYFKSLASPAVSVDNINLGSGGVLVLSQIVSESWTWTESVSQTVTACPICGPATLCGLGTIVC